MSCILLFFCPSIGFTHNTNWHLLQLHVNCDLRCMCFIMSSEDWYMKSVKVLYVPMEIWEIHNCFNFPSVLVASLLFGWRHWMQFTDKALGKIWACVSQPLSLSFQEDPRLKYPVHMRTKASLDPGDLGPLPVSIIGALEPYYPQIHVLSADKYPCLICDLVLMHKYEWNIHITQ